MQDLSLKERNYIVNAVTNLLTCGIYMLVFLSNSPWAGSLLNVFTPERVPNSKAALWPPERLIAIDCGTGPVARILVQWRHLGNPHGRNRPNAGMDDSGIARPGEVEGLSACWFRQSSPGTQRCGRAGVERETRLLFRYPPLSARGGGVLSGVQV